MWCSLSLSEKCRPTYNFSLNVSIPFLVIVYITLCLIFLRSSIQDGYCHSQWGRHVQWEINIQIRVNQYGFSMIDFLTFIFWIFGYNIQCIFYEQRSETSSFLSFVIKLCLSSFPGCFLTTRLPCLPWLSFLLLCLFLHHIKLRGEFVGIFSWKGAVVSQGHKTLLGESLDAVRRWSLSHALYKADAWGTFISFTVWCVSNVTL